MPDFSKGKWRYLECSREIFASATQIEDDPFGLAIAEISFDPDIPEKEKHANGRLIANAPDMYRILCNIRKWCEDHIFVKEFEQDIQNVLEAIEGMEGGEA